jgi:hypothetical protein
MLKILNIKLKIYTTDKKSYIFDAETTDYVTAKAKAAEIMKNGYTDEQELGFVSVRPEVMYPPQSIQKIEIIIEKL